MISLGKTVLVASVFVLTLILVFIVTSTNQTAKFTATDQSENHLPVGASYMTFWGTGMPGHDWNSGAPVDFPIAALGNYSSDNVSTAGLQIEMAANQGINFFFLDYGWGDNSSKMLMENAALNGIINATESAESSQNFSFCIFYFPNWRVSDASINVTGLTDDFSHISKTYFDHPSYLRFDGRPVVILADFPKYIGKNLTDGGTNQTFSYEALNDQFYVLKEDYSLYLIPAFWPNWNAPAECALLNDSRRVYDAITLWGDTTIIDWNASISYSDYVNKTQLDLDTWSRIASGYKVDFVPLICPGYTRVINSVYYNNSDQKWWAIVTRDPTENLTLWKGIWQLAQNYADSGNNSYHMVLLFTWNDYNEGTYVEPSMEYNSTYLDVIPEFQSNTAPPLIVPLIMTSALSAVALYKRRHPRARSPGFGPKWVQVQYFLILSVLWRDRNDHELYGLECESGSDRARPPKQTWSLISLSMFCVQELS